ncbi:NADP-dependent oxidoreductase domain-containing protein 1 [Gastrophryne carolinensis]
MSQLVDLLAGLDSLQFEFGIPAQHRGLTKLKRRRHALTSQACADAIVLCRLLFRTRQQLAVVSPTSLHTPPSRGVHIGIIGAGHLGKQLARCLLDQGVVRPDHLSVSTRRPETLREFQDRGVWCFYDNARLVREAELIFLCCLPSQLPAVCAEIAGHLSWWCVVVSLMSAVPLPRLENLLGHGGVIRPEYDTDLNGDDSDHISLSLRGGALVEAAAFREPHDNAVRRIMEPALYALLNVCTSHDLSRSQSLSILNGLINVGGSGQPGFTSSDFVGEEFASSLSEDSSPFPRFSLVQVQMKETQLRHILARCPHFSAQLSRLYCSLLCYPDSQRAT